MSLPEHSLGAPPYQHPSSSQRRTPTDQADGGRHAAVEYDLGTLRVLFPGWTLFRSDTGAFYATRRGVQLNDAELDAGLHQTVSADDADTFVALLHEQHLRGWSCDRTNA